MLLGDLGQTYNSLSTLQHYMHSGAQSVLFVGDLSYSDRYEHNDGIRWDTWGRFIERSAAYQPWIWTAGNHEIEYRPELVTSLSCLLPLYARLLYLFVDIRLTQQLSVVSVEASIRYFKM